MSAATFEEASKSVDAKRDLVKQEQTKVFAGVGLWSGIAATVASATLTERILDLEEVKRNLDAAANFLHESAATIVSTKIQITSNVEIANAILAWIEVNPDIPEDSKQSALSEGIAAVRQENASLVTAAASEISTAKTHLSADAGKPADVSFFHGAGSDGGPTFSPASRISGVGGDDLVQGPPPGISAGPGAPLPANSRMSEVGGSEAVDDPAPGFPPVG
ncbi:hypothetical protein, partial [Mycobacterium sp. 1164985.4]|uniref:hypothetical protein n=1 Tax=Mycobacterium sp. 1164985.4 TaxID=1834069 RepID=UPI0018D4A68B